jgi:uncharacterized membrane protein YbhN (UPF0104 family)
MRLVTLTKITGETLPALDVIKVVLSNYFLALVTPGATGGAVAQIMFMKKAGIPVAKSTVVIFISTIMSIMFLIIVVPFFMNVDSSVKGWVPMYVIVTVSLLFTAMPIAAVYLMHTQYPQSASFILAQDIFLMNCDVNALFGIKISGSIFYHGCRDRIWC